MDMMMMNMPKWKKNCKKVLEFLLSPRFLLCFGLAWLITNGWSYILMAVGTLFQIGWMMAVAGAYLDFLWLPFTPEKVITVTISIFLLKRLFPNDQKTLAVLHALREKAHNALQKKKEAHRASEEK